MYQEVAFDPQCLEEYQYYGLLKSQFGFEKGRYIIAPVKEWVRAAQKAVKESKHIQPIKKATIKNYLNKIQKSRTEVPITLPKYREIEKLNQWPEWCKKALEVAPFNSIISERFELGLTLDEILDNPNCWNIAPTVQIRKTSSEIVGVIAPLINLGGTLTIIDQYFKLSNNAVLEGIINAAISKPSVSSITIVTAVNTASPEKVFQNQYLSLYPTCPSVNLIVAPEKYFHDRYVISELGAIKAGHGFSEAPELGAQSDLLSISLCGSDEVASTIKKLFQVVNEGKATKLILHKYQAFRAIDS